MIPTPVAYLVAFVLIAGSLLAAQGLATARKGKSQFDAMLLDDDSAFPACPPDFVRRLFSPDDSKFISQTNSSQLSELFQRERKQVALVWVQQTSAAIQRTMRDHKQIARVSSDIDFQTEVKLLCLYSELLCLCGALSLAIQSIGPLRVRAIAVYADAHSQRLAQVEHSFRAATSPRELPRVGAV
jgi:hypothetical protein